MDQIDVSPATMAPLEDQTRVSVSLFGATGSIGTSTIDLLKRSPERYDVYAVTANSNIDELADIARLVGAKVAVIADSSHYRALRDLLEGSGIKAASGLDALIEVAEHPVDIVLGAVVGAAGLVPAYRALGHCKRLALANKECLVSAGQIFMDRARETGTEILPVDSEHSALFQVFETDNADQIDQLILTASGGPFRNWDKEQIDQALPEHALKHPNWSMGAKITIDSASMMNKGLELIEAYHLFPVESEQLGVLVHPQSIIHGLVSYKDGSVLAQLGMPDMRTPIAHCLNWPKRGTAPTERLDLAKMATLTFEEPDEKRFPALRLAREAMREGGAATNILNAANEIAVEAFLDRRIAFGAMASLVETVLARSGRHNLAQKDLQDALAIDRDTRRLAADILPDFEE